MSRSEYRLLAFSTLPVVGAVVWALGPLLADWLCSTLADEDTGHVVRLLGYLLAVLAGALVWAALMLPFRSRAGFTPISVELAAIRKEGIVQAYSRERAALEHREASSDPKVRAKVHFVFAATGAMLGLGGGILAWAFYLDGELWIYPIGFALVGSALALYYLVLGLREWSR